MNKRIIPVIVIVAAVGLGVVYFREKNQNSDRILKVSGNIEAIEISLSFRSSGKLVECLVDEGYSVKRDKVLARLNKDELIKIKDGFITVIKDGKYALNWTHISCHDCVDNQVHFQGFIFFTHQ